MITTRITHPLPPPSGQDSIDIFSSSLSALFTDDTQTLHGTPGSHVTYTSPRFGELTLRIPAHPDAEEGRRLFAHYLWNAGVLVADGLEQGSREAADETDDRVETWDPRFWDVRGKRVLELGAGTALPSLITALAGASAVAITDHPNSPALVAAQPNAIALNVQHNLFPSAKPPRSTAAISICGYVWGEKAMYSADRYGTPVPNAAEERYDRIIIADCLWLPSQHENLVKTISHFLDDKAKGSCALVIAGFHTGRGIVRDFFDIATAGTERAKEEDPKSAEERKNGVSVQHGDETFQGKLRVVEVFEIDVDGRRREWMPVRPGESKEDAKRWCVVAVLAKR